MNRVFLLRLAHVSVLWLLLGIDVTEARRRWKRQSLPGDHIKVHSFDGNLTKVGDSVSLLSPESRIDVTELHFASTIFSNDSVLTYNLSGDFVNLTAHQTMAVFNLNTAQFYSHANSFKLSEQTNVKSDLETTLNVELETAVNLTLADSATIVQVEAVNGRKAVIVGGSWRKEIPRKLILSSSVVQDTLRQLVISSVANNYNIRITLDGAQVGLVYGQVRLDFAADYRTLLLTTKSHIVKLQTVTSPFVLTITDQTLEVVAEADKTKLNLHPNSSDVDISVSQPSALTMQGLDGAIAVQGSPVPNDVKYLKLDSNQLLLNLIAGQGAQDTAIHTSSNISRLIMHSMRTDTLVGSHHFVEIRGGNPNMLLLTGNISCEIRGNSQGLSTVTLIPPFAAPADKFADIDAAISRFHLPDNNPSGSATFGVPPTQGPGIVVPTEPVAPLVTVNPAQTGNENGRPETGSQIENIGWTAVTPNTIPESPATNPPEGLTVPVLPPDETANTPGSAAVTTAPNDGEPTPAVTQGPPTVPVTLPPPQQIGNEAFPTPSVLVPETVPPPTVPNGTQQNVDGSANTATRIETDFPRPETLFPSGIRNRTIDNFTISQYGNDTGVITLPLSQPQPTIEGYPIFATISNIELMSTKRSVADDFPRPPPTISEPNSTAIYLISTSTPLRFMRDDVRRPKDSMQMKLRISRSVDVTHDGFLAEVESGLSDLLALALSNHSATVNGSRVKRTPEDFQAVVQEVERSEEDPEIVRVTFYVDRPDYFRDLPFLADKLNRFGHEVLSDKLKYEVISSVELSDKTVMLISVTIITAGVLALIVLSLVVLRCRSINVKLLQSALNQRKVQHIPDSFASGH